VLRDIGRIAGAESSLIIIKETEKYLRGRTNQEMIDLFNEGIAQSRRKPEVLVAPTEGDALEAAISRANAGDAVAVMCHEQLSELAARLNQLGRQIEL
jgi:cyanophycin synthetase